MDFEDASENLGTREVVKVNEICLGLWCLLQLLLCIASSTWNYHVVLHCYRGKMTYYPNIISSEIWIIVRSTHTLASRGTLCSNRHRCTHVVYNCWHCLAARQRGCIGSCLRSGWGIGCWKGGILGANWMGMIDGKMGGDFVAIGLQSGNDFLARIVEMRGVNGTIWQKLSECKNN